VPRPDPPGPVGVSSAADGLTRFVRHHFPVLFVAVLALTAFNLTFRLADGAITEWDESLYALSAAEMLETDDWVATRFLGRIDYYNAKPPLNVWLIALSFKAFGISTWSLRLVSLLSAWCTVLVLVLWARQIAGPLVALAAGVVLSSSFGFIFVHSARTANTDALYTLLIVLTAVVVHRSVEHPWARLWLGPVLAAAFLLRGPAVLMPAAIIALVEMWNRPARVRRWPLTCAAMLFALPTGLWMLARWRVDEWRFIEQLWSVDLVARMMTPLEGHVGGPLFYVNVLQKYQYEWLIAAAAGLGLVWPAPEQWRAWLYFWRTHAPAKVVIACWGLVAFAIPTLMQTKLTWYLDPFYPVFALAIALILRHALVTALRAGRSRRVAAVIVIVLIAAGTAEGRLVYQSYRGDAKYLLQGLLQSERAALAGHTLFRSHWNHAERFVVTHLIGARLERLHRDELFVDESEPGDFLVSSVEIPDPRVEKIRGSGRWTLYRRVQPARKRR
jgi:4-amino-4-deoxy-L-arabinose transferase-like glycosyltransferase